MVRAAEAEQGTIEVDQDRKDELRKRLADLRRGSDRSKFSEGEVLAEIIDGSYWESYGFNSFDEYCAKELGFGKRTGYRRAAVWRTFAHEFGCSAEQLADFQWSKLELIQPVVKKSNFERWLEDAAKLTFDQLEYKVRDAVAVADGKDPTKRKTSNATTRVQEKGVEDDADGNEPKVTHRCVMYQSQYDNLKAAIETACEQLGTDKANYALDMIASDFQASLMTGEKDVSFKRLQVICEDLGRAFNARITVTMNEGAVAEQFKADRESSKERKKKLKAQKKAQAGDTQDPETGEKIDPDTGEPLKKPAAKSRKKKK